MPNLHALAFTIGLLEWRYPHWTWALMATAVAIIAFFGWTCRHDMRRES